MKKMLLTAIIMAASINVLPFNYHIQQNRTLNNIIIAKEQIALTNDDLSLFQTYINIFMTLQNYNINTSPVKTELISKIDEVLEAGDYKNISSITQLYELKKELIATDDKTILINSLHKYSSDIRDKVKNNLKNMILILEKIRKKNPAEISHLISNCNALIDRISNFNLDNKDSIISFLFEVIQFKDAVIIQLTNMINNLINIASDDKYNIIKIKLEQIKILQNNVKDLKEEIAIAQIGITEPKVYDWHTFHRKRETNYNWLRYYQPKLEKISFSYKVHIGQCLWAWWVDTKDGKHEIHYNNLPIFYDDLSDNFSNSSIELKLEKKEQNSDGWWVHKNAVINFKVGHVSEQAVGGFNISNVTDIGIWEIQYLVIKNFETQFHLNKKYSKQTLKNLQNKLGKTFDDINKLESEIRLLEN
ncbi:hypothetical protein [Spiroplasma endosymbiont of Stenodema calcarata]|uniref:hypothetical protein n=1 Tax=Spiroplasma endosymbiont of Stenodema calcarata TaxID=3139328 RepID=UPI003CCA8A4F